MAEIDRAAARSGLSSYGLMRAAGHAVAATALAHFPQALRFVVLAGPGNNGGDGWVAARVLAEAGAAVAVYALYPVEGLKGDAKTAAEDAAMDALALAEYQPQPGDVVIDALFGAGLTRSVPEAVQRVIAAVQHARLPVLAIDLPSGVDGRSGAVLGAAFEADRTVTFVSRKPGHLLLPGRTLCGALEVAEIGIPRRIVAAHASPIFANGPLLWRDAVKALDPSAHKYRRGHLLVCSGGPVSSGAARMSATAGLAGGAGLVSMVAPRNAMLVLATHLTAVMLKPADGEEAFAALLSDARYNALVIGPGLGNADRARAFTALVAREGRRLVLDADGLSAFKEAPEILFNAFSGELRLVLTPHDGEFSRLFPDLAGDESLSKIDRAFQAARRANAVIVLKGADTVIAAPDGRVAINSNAPPWLATAGTGDVLAGLVGAHLAQSMPPFEAAASAVWRHGEAAVRAGEGMTAEDLLRAIAPLPHLDE